ncbi:hypothetical protein CBL_05418 [Carabus blaptoides fortunei]
MPDPPSPAHPSSRHLNGVLPAWKWAARCAFLTYFSPESALNAQNALHEKHTLPGSSTTTAYAYTEKRRKRAFYLQGFSCCSAGDVPAGSMAFVVLVQGRKCSQSAVTRRLRKSD